jgi:hypothetical protein
MDEDAPTSAKHGRRTHVRGMVRGTVLGRSNCQRKSLSTDSLSSTPYDRMVVWCQIMRPDLWSYFGMPHILT